MLKIVARLFRRPKPLPWERHPTYREWTSGPYMITLDAYDRRPNGSPQVQVYRNGVWKADAYSIHHAKYLCSVWAQNDRS